MNFTRKHRIVVSLAAVAVIGAGVWAGTRPLSVAHAKTSLAVADPPPQTMTFGGCTGTAGTENLITNPSAYGTRTSNGVGVSATYQDETAITCHQWGLDNSPVSDDCTATSPPPNNQNNTNLCFTFPPTPGPFTITLFVVDGDHGGNWDEYVWNVPACYPPTGQTTLNGVSIDSKGAVTGTLNFNCVPQNGFQVDEFNSSGAVIATNNTNGQGVFNFPNPPPGTGLPLYVYFPGGTHGQTTLSASSNHATCSSEPSACPTSSGPPPGSCYATTPMLTGVSTNAQGAMTGTLMCGGQAENGFQVLEFDHTGAVIAQNNTNGQGVFNFPPPHPPGSPMTLYAYFPGGTSGPNSLPASSNYATCNPPYGNPCTTSPGTPPASCYSPGQAPSLSGVTITSQGAVTGTLSYTCVPENGPNQVNELDSSGNLLKQSPTNGQKQFNFPNPPPSTSQPIYIYFPGNSNLQASSNYEKCTYSPNTVACNSFPGAPPV